MSFVYKYEDANHAAMYVGKVNGNSLNDLFTRISAHKSDFNGHAEDYKIFYAVAETPADADILETALIANLHPVFNKAKTSWGSSTFRQLTDTIAWIALDDWREIHRELHEFEEAKVGRDMTHCDVCGFSGFTQNFYRVCFSCFGDSADIMIEGYICEDCIDKWLSLGDHIFDLMHDSFKWRRARCGEEPGV